MKSKILFQSERVRSACPGAGDLQSFMALMLVVSALLKVTPGAAPPRLQPR
jgi:hypothetical protein